VIINSSRHKSKLVLKSTDVKRTVYSPFTALVWHTSLYQYHQQTLHQRAPA